MLILHNALCNSRNRHGNAVVGRTLALYDLIGAVAHLLIQALHGCLVVEMSPQFAEMIQIDSGNTGHAHRRVTETSGQCAGNTGRHGCTGIRICIL